jgi:hypothetical protein
MRVLMIAAAGLAVACCGPKGTPAAQPAPVSVTAQPPAETLADQAMLSQAGTIRAALIPSLLAKNCRSAGGDLPCRNLTIACAFQESVSPSDQANGVAYRVVFVTGFETKGATAQPWQARGEYLRVEIAPDGSWNSVGVADRNGGACTGDTENQVTRVLTFSP